ncbi:RNA polymerase sigma-70 factor [uncultured Alistipes sp.]|uniref:RNA polymerase sigma-70 factor n=1 Tax=uncultured Alistipes sp. TaxID=538949 RepID=UPI0025E16F65|nr:RNA polymerase sigma-70 factor [uncultured Alistipes sp.]
MAGPDATNPGMMHNASSSELILFNELYSKHYEGFVRFADSYVRDRPVAEDLVAESFMAFWSNRETMAPDSNFRAFLLTVLKNKCLNHMRLQQYQHKRLHDIGEVSQWDFQMRISTLEACDPEEVFSAEIQSLLEKAVQKLPQRTLQVFVLSRYEHKSNKEIAEMLGITVKGVEFHITKSLELLRIQLKDYLAALILLNILY